MPVIHYLKVTNYTEFLKKNSLRNQISEHVPLDFF